MKLVEDFVNKFPDRIQRITAFYVTIGGHNSTIRMYYNGRTVIDSKSIYRTYNLYRDRDFIEECITGKKKSK